MIKSELREFYNLLSAKSLPNAENSELENHNLNYYLSQVLQLGHAHRMAIHPSI